MTTFKEYYILEEGAKETLTKWVAAGLVSAAAYGMFNMGRSIHTMFADQLNKLKDPTEYSEEQQTEVGNWISNQLAIGPPPDHTGPDTDTTDINATQVIIDATANMIIFNEDNRTGPVVAVEAQNLVDEDRNASVRAMKEEEGQPGTMLNRIRRTWDHLGQDNRDFGYAYDTFAVPGRQDWTIGYGHHDSFISAPIRAQVMQLLNIEDWEPIRRGQQSLTEQQMDALFEFDYDRKELDVEQSVGDEWDNLPQWVRAAMVNGNFRGDLGPDTKGAIRDGSWDHANNGDNPVAMEYRNHGNWDDNDGVATRMRRNERRFLIYGLFQRRFRELSQQNQ